MERVISVGGKGAKVADGDCSEAEDMLSVKNWLKSWGTLTMTRTCWKWLRVGSYYRTMSPQKESLYAQLNEDVSGTVGEAYESGLALTLAKKEVTKMFLEVARDSSNKAEPLPGGNYLCYQEPGEKHSDPTAIFPGELFVGKDVDVIVSSMSPNTYKYDKVIMEFQVIT